MIIPGIFGTPSVSAITGKSPIGGVVGTFGITGSIGPVGSAGIPGPVGIPGTPGSHPDEKLITIFCKKDYGFIKSGQYLKVFTYPGFNMISFRSEDNNMSFNLSEQEADEYFVWRITEFREHKLGSIGI